MRFVVIRHGQSTNNLLWETTGSELGRHPDTPLTETGHRQAELLAERLSAVLPWRVDAIYCSLMTRAVQTAAPIAAALGLPLIGRTDMFEVGGLFDLDLANGDRFPYPGASADDSVRSRTGSCYPTASRTRVGGQDLSRTTPTARRHVRVASSPTSERSTTTTPPWRS